MARWRADMDRWKAEVKAQTMDHWRVEMDGWKGELSAGLQAEVAAKIAGGLALKGMPPMPPMVPQMIFKDKRHDTGDRGYDRGKRALESRRWDEALEAFSEVASAGGARADGALYWKAYTLGKLGRRDDGLAALAELRKAHPSSRWLDDAKALEAEMRQASGQRATPETESDEDLKLMALNGLVESDPERALPLIENLLKSSRSPRLRERALFVLAQSSAPRGKQVLEQVARGSAGNPDLQLKAIQYMVSMNRKTDQGILLSEIYASSNDTAVKRMVLNGFAVTKDKEHLLQIARTEKTPALRLDAVSMLGAAGAQAELWQLYQQESAVEVKERILHSLIAGGAADRLTELAKSEKDPKLRRSAIRALGSMGATKSGGALLAMYGPESDKDAKRAILEGLFIQRNAKGLVDLARQEQDPSLKREIVGQLSRMKSKEAADYMMELLK
jgi:hypothetical protein